MKRLAVDKSMLFQALAIALGLVSALILGRGGFAVSPDMMVELASTKWDYNANALDALASQAIDTRVGTFLLVLSVLFQLLSLRPAVEAPSKGGSRNAIVVAVAVGIAAWFLGGMYANAQAKKMMREAEAIWAARSTSQ
jgi:hypothetical protein